MWNPIRENKQLKSALKERDNEILKLRAKVSTLSRINVPVNLEDDMPEDEEGRKAYVISVVTFYENILKKKILNIISGIRGRLAKVDSTVDNNGNKIVSHSPQEFDLLLKGTENAFWLLDDWCGDMVSEYMENQKSLSEEDKSRIKKIIQT